MTWKSNIEDKSCPPGWSFINDIGGPFIVNNGPIFKYDLELGPDEPVRFGFKIEERHCNMRMVCHGGMLASFIDLCLARGATHGLTIKIGAPTMNLSIDYLTPAKLGEWIESRTTLLHRTQTTAFVETLIVRQQSTLVRGSAIYRLPRQES